MKKTLFNRFLAAVLIALLTLSAGMALAQEDIRTSAIEDDGVVRVYLKSLSAPQNLTITLDGVYTVEHDAGFRFDEGTQIVLSEGDEGIWLCAGGLTIDMGSGLTLTRQASDGEENGLRIAETGRENLYAGDLTVTREQGGGLRAVLAINMEDYLCGVVAYEMSDSWPVEALKAQAVAARTYAMQRKWNAGTRDYDVVDTTADQVFKGYNGEYTNVIEAVRATQGVVGTWNGGFATCYYTASNGGETALPEDVWSSDGDYGYLARSADPYDLENPNSMVSSLTFTPGAQDCPVLHDMLQQGLIEAAKAQGVETEGLELEEILSIEPVEPVAEGSIMFTKLRFTVSASAPVEVFIAGEEDAGAPSPALGSASADAALTGIDYLRRLLLRSPYVQSLENHLLEQSFTVDLDVYDQIKDKLNLSLNAADYEVVSVVKGVFDYTIEMRRFGHGVGMSQRGAQRMAGVHGKTWLEILKFYYPGMTLERIEWNAPELERIEALDAHIGAARPDPTPTPTPAPLPALQGSEYYARVSLGDASSSLNMRQSAGTQSPVVTQLSNGQRVIVCGEEDAEGWVSVKTAEASGFVKLEYLVKE